MAQYLESVDFPPAAPPTEVSPTTTSPVAAAPRPVPPIAAAPTVVEPVEKPEPSWIDAEVEVSIATYQAYQILYFAFTGLLAVASLTKFLHVLAPWDTYVSPAMSSFLHMSPGAVVILAGLIELLAAAAVALKPRIGSWVFTGWMLLIVLNLLMMQGHYEMILIGLALGAAGLAFTRLSAECN